MLSTNKIAIITITHNSEKELKLYFESLKENDLISQVILLDSGSDDSSYLNEYKKNPIVTVIQDGNIGFCKGNNNAILYLNDDIDYVAFINPDIIFDEQVFDKLISDIENNKNIAMISPLLYRYMFKKNGEIIKTDEIDSAGIMKTWYGRYYDSQKILSNNIYFPVALCGAFLFCQLSAIRNLEIKKNKLFDEDFYMYKEDIELSLRCKKNNYQVALDPNIKSYHGRGWKKREKISYWQKNISSINDFRLLKFMPFCERAIAWLYYLIKRLYVLVIEK